MKDPAFLLYFQDYAWGVRRLTFEQKGAYMDILCEQADAFTKSDGANYLLSIENIKEILGKFFDNLWPTLKLKFDEKGGKFFNAKLLEVMIARKRFTESRSHNRLGKKNIQKKDKKNTRISSAQHMEDEIENENEEENTNENLAIIKNIIDYLNIKLESNYKYKSKPTQRHILARLREKYTLEDFKKVIDAKVKQWVNDKEMRHFLRPETLFGNKFEGYLMTAQEKRETEYTPEPCPDPVDISEAITGLTNKIMKK